MKKIFFVLPIVLFLAAGCGSKQPAVQNQPVNVSLTQTRQAGAPAQDAATAEPWQIYTNTDFNFRLVFPATWQGYQVEKRAASEAGQGITLYDVGFEASGKNVGLFVFGVYPKDIYQNLQPVNGIRPAIIKEENNLVFTYAPEQDYSGARTDLAKDVPNIISTLTFLK
jgi:hypothetical protein